MEIFALGVVSVTAVVLKQPWQGEAVNSNAFYGWLFREPRREGNSEFAMVIWCFWISDCMFVISLSTSYWLLQSVCERDRVTSAILIATCMCVRERNGHSVQRVKVLIAACLHIHKSIITECHATQFPSQAWTDGKTKDIINCLYFSFESWRLLMISRLFEPGLNINLNLQKHKWDLLLKRVLWKSIHILQAAIVCLCFF